MTEDPREPFHPMQPQEALGVFTEQLDRRFQGFSESEQSKLIDAMKWEDRLLNQYIEKNRLVEWVRATFDAAQDEVEITADDATRAGASAELQPTRLFDQGADLVTEDVLAQP